MVASQERSRGSLDSRHADCKSTMGDNKVLKAGYAWEKAFDWKMVKPAVVEVMKGNNSGRQPL